VKRITISIIATILIWMISGIALADINDGLMAYYPFSANANDESGNENHGTVNGATLAFDRFGNADSAYSFDGVDDNLSLPESQYSGDDFTWSYWAKSTFDSQYRTFLTIGGQLVLYYLGDDLKIYGTDTSINGERTISDVLTQDIWIHYVFQYHSGELALYKNGEYFSSVVINVGSEPRTAMIGGGIPGNPYQYFHNGSIDDIRMYNRLLSEDEMRQLYNENESEYNVLLVHSNNQDGSTNFSDSSKNQHEIIVHGEVHHEVDQAKFDQSSIYFDGDGDYLEIPNSDDWHFGEKDYTIECFVNFSSFNPDGFDTIMWHGDATNAAFHFDYKNSTNELRFIYYSGDTPVLDLAGPWNPVLGTWHHIAFVRSGNSGFLFVDGHEISSVASMSSVDFEDSPLYIGTRPEINWDREFHGYIDELRISKGIGRWTSDFTPPSRPYGSSPKYITATIDHTKVDEDLTDFPVLIHLSQESGTNSFDASAMFDELNGGIDANTVLSIHSDHAPDSISFEDSSPYNHSITPQGNIQHKETQKIFGKSAIYFDGSGDYLEVPDSDDWYFGSEDFTIDFWVRFNQIPSDNFVHLISQYPDDTTLWTLYLDNRNSLGNPGLRFGARNGGSDVISLSQGSMTGWSPGTWYHVALIRYGEEFYLFKDGVSIVTQSGSTPMPQAASTLKINGRQLAGGNEFTGYMDELRISKGIARWTSNFTPPGRPYSDDIKKFAIYDQNGSQCYTEIGRWDATNKEAWLWVKIPEISATEDTDLMIHYAKTMQENTDYIGDTDDAPAQNVWDDYIGVWHFEGGFIESTANRTYNVSQNVEIDSNGIQDELGQSLKVNGGSGYGVEVPNFPAFSESTIELIMKPYDRGPGSWANIILSKDDFELVEYNWDGQESAKNITFYWAGSTNYTVQQNEAAYVVASFDGTSVKIFKDGIYDRSFTSGYSQGEGDLWISARKNRHGYTYKGYIDELRISNTSRSDAWIKATYHSNFDDLIAYIHPDDITPPPVVDALTVSDDGDGTIAFLDWSGYAATAPVDIVNFRIYVEALHFTDASTLSHHDIVNAGTYTYTVESLTEGSTYYFAVVAVDGSGNFINNVAPISGVPNDTDRDLDGVLNDSDNCPEDENPDQKDNDSGDVYVPRTYFTEAGCENMCYSEYQTLNDIKFFMGNSSIGGKVPTIHGATGRTIDLN